MDFFKIREKATIKGKEQNIIIEIYPEFVVGRQSDLMVRGNGFYAIWDESTGLWSTDEYDVAKMVDSELIAYKEAMKNTNDNIKVKLMSNFSSKSWLDFKNYMTKVADAYHQLDMHLTFANTKVKKKDYVSKQLPYPLEAGKNEAYTEIMQTLYDKEERAKLEWAIGSIVAGDSVDLQKFIVLYGEMGSGKSTFLNILQKLFPGYYIAFDAKALTSSNNAFATDVFRDNPLIAIQHDSDLSKIEDNTKLNSIVSHEYMTMNEKYRASYAARTNCLLFIGTNKPVKITDAKAGMIRRLIDVSCSGRKIPIKRYQTLTAQIDFELGAIAQHCLDVYREMGKNYYSSYRPVEMMFRTDVFFNFVEENFNSFKEQNGVRLIQAYNLYKSYCSDSLVEFLLPKHKFKDELKNYFTTFSDMTHVDGCTVRSYYSGFITNKFTSISHPKEEHPDSLSLDHTESILDDICRDCPAQYATDGKPTIKWSEVKTRLADLNTKEVHYVKLPENHICIDFDLPLEQSIEIASKMPPTYTELSKSGEGLHLHYIYDGDVSKLSRVYSEGVEVKLSVGNSSLRRRLTKCNNIQIATISSGLPLKEGEKVINFESVQSEKGLRDLIIRNLRKEIHPGTKPSIDFINKILNDAYASGMVYDITDMRPRVLAFANNSTHQSEGCVKIVGQMKFCSESNSPIIVAYSKDELVFFDVEVYPNLFIIGWKVKGKSPVKMINPTSAEVEALLSFKLVGFNCRRYDNHIMYARYIGYDNAQLYTLSQRIINGSRNCMFREAYNISYTDVYDFSSKKQSLKKFEIELGIHHQELGLPWDEPVDESKWDLVADYCINDVIATEAVFDDRKQDFVARQIISELSGLSPNDTTQTHAAKIIFGDDPKPQDKFVYTDLSEMFPGYTFEHGVSQYRGEDPGEGGYVHALPGMYTNAPLLDVESMHPWSLILMNCFGPYTGKFKELLDARLTIKHKDYNTAKTMLDGRLAPYLKDEEHSEELAYALKIIINIVYGLTSAKFSNKFKDPRNVDNIVAKRGALFMIDLKHAVEEKGFIAAHIKTDSIKIPDASPEIIEFVNEFGKKYGYNFEHEATYEKLCLANDAVYIAKVRVGKHAGEWIAVGAQFAQPYVFKSLFTKEPIVFEDLCETKSVTSALYLDMNEGCSQDEHVYHFIGKIGSFCPIKPGRGGGLLLREKEGKYYAATGTKGYRWLEAEVVKMLGKKDDIDKTYYASLVDDAVEDISKFGDFEWFLNGYAIDYENLPF